MACRAPFELIGTVLTGDGWRTYFATPHGELLVRESRSPTSTAEPTRLLGAYVTVASARNAGRRALARDIRCANDDARVPVADIGQLLRSLPNTDWVTPPVTEGPVAPFRAARALPSALRPQLRGRSS